jgi:hypothetical protein
VAGQLHDEFDDVDYFPSYEIVTNPAAKSGFFEPNLRSVHPSGVASVMRVFFDAHGMAEQAEPPAPAPRKAAPPAPPSEEDVVCEEMLLEAFAGAPR